MLKAQAITHTFRAPVRPPPWWEGHIIYFKEYPFGVGSYGFGTLNLSSRDAEKQQSAPYKIGQRIRCAVGGQWMYGEVADIDIYRPGWATDHKEPNEFDPEEDPGEWEITVSFPGLPKPSSDSHV